MDFESEINKRLAEMKNSEDPNATLWPEKCMGSRKSLVIFVGPSPGGDVELDRRPRKLHYEKPLWNIPYMEPIQEWSTGFKQSFKPIVEEVLGQDYEISGRLVSVVNMDWMQNPESKNVVREHMKEGCSHILPVIKETKPLLIIPMDQKTFNLFKAALIIDGFDLDPIVEDEVYIKIYEKDGNIAEHSNIKAFKANKDNLSFLVINSFQHPSHIYNKEYATRIGKAIRLAADQIWNNKPVRLIFK